VINGKRPAYDEFNPYKNFWDERRGELNKDNAVLEAAKAIAKIAVVSEKLVKTTNPFDIPTFVLVGILQACALFEGMKWGFIPVPCLAAGIAILLFPALFHLYGLGSSIKHSHTIPAVIIGSFTGFWLLEGTAITLMSMPSIGPVFPKHSFEGVLLCVMVVIALIVFVTQLAYRHDKRLEATLIMLGITVSILAFLKLPGISNSAWIIRRSLHGMSIGTTIEFFTVGVLGLMVTYVIVYRLLTIHIDPRHAPAKIEVDGVTTDRAELPEQVLGFGPEVLALAQRALVLALSTGVSLEEAVADIVRTTS